MEGLIIKSYKTVNTIYKFYVCPILELLESFRII